MRVDNGVSKPFPYSPLVTKTVKQRTVACITGAHRSGTSMVTRLLHACGLDLGPESDLMPPAPDNPDGFWENLSFIAMNDELLNELGAAWDLPPRSTPFAEKRFAAMRSRARRLVSAFSQSNVWGWKDPRNSLTLPFWHAIIPKLRTIIVVRNPLEVAYSLHQRNRVSFHLGLSLWGVYNQRALSATAPENRIVSHYDSFFDDPHAELLRILSFLGLPDSKAANAAALISSERRHTHFTTQQLLDAQIPPQLFELYQQLCTEAGRVTDAELAAGNLASEAEQRSRDGKASDEALASDAMPLPESPALNLAVVEADKLQKQLAAHNAEFQRLNAHIEQISSAIHHLEEELKQRDAALAADNAEFQRLNTHIDQISSAFSRVQKQLTETKRHHEIEIEQVRERFAQANRLLHSKSISLAESEARITDLMARLRQQLHDAKRLTRLLGSLEDVTARLRSSRRWKLANPIVSLRNKFLRGGEPVGYDHLDKVVAAYQLWRSAHPELEDLDEQIQQLHRQAGLKSSRTLDRGDTIAPPVSKPIEFPVFDKVEVSIIIPVFNQFHFTQACLASVQEHRGSHAIEVIVVDDGSADATADFVPRMKGIVYLRNETNAGFVGSCNRGAAKARGEYLLFLNNDTSVKQGWLDALLETFQLEPRAGLVGSKLLFPDGRLQEAGGIIWRDGSGWNYGKFDDPRKPEYNYLRDVDYCSGACAMVPKSLFESIGGFDARYAPAYYEDTDLSFKIRQNGYKVLYQPLSEVIHYEGATGGTDTSTGAKRHQEINREKFVLSWANVLASKPENADLVSYFACKPGQKRILVIDHHLPMPEKDSGSVRMFQVLKLLRGLGHRVTFVPDNLADIAPYADEIRKHGIEVVHHPYIKSVRQHLSERGAEYDVIILSRCNFARKHVVDVRRHAPQSRLIFDTVDLQFLRESREAELTQDADVQRTADEKRTQEHELINQADETWVVSSVEQTLLRERIPGKRVEIVSNIVDAPGSATPFALRRDFLLIGGFQHTPNIDAVVYFVREIYPLVEARLRSAKFYIIGDKAPPSVVALASENVIVAGLQPDVRPYFESVKLSVAPLRWGAGVKGKINQSMGFGVPVIATSVAAEGMGLTHGEDILVADEPENFAKALLELYHSEDLWNRLSKNGIQKTKLLYSKEVARKQLKRLLSDEHMNSSSAARIKIERRPAEQFRNGNQAAIEA
jgi:GT2 family glycosyltransferase/predicted  nucleic acid-binding Zn-ribbon protein